MDLATERFSACTLHHAHWVDDFCPFAAELRDELLRFPSWKAMRLGSVHRYAFQTAITTGHIQGRFPELRAAHRMEELLLHHAAALCRLVSAESAPPIDIDLSAIAYGEGGRLLPHTDSIVERRLAFILYLTPPDDGEWATADGGTLMLIDRESGRREEIRPRFNRFAVFRVSDASWHEITPMVRPTPWDRCRLALTGWLHDRLRQDR